MKVFSMFSGVGGFEIGLSRAFGDKLEVVGFSEIDKHACSVLAHNFPKIHNFGDCTKIDTKQLPDFDMLVGGVPCQSWSTSGGRLGFDDHRGRMWYEFARVLNDKQPSYFLAENVKGLMQHDEGRSIEKICELLCSKGYAIDIELINPKYLGIPHNRERLFIFGIKLDLLKEDEVF